MFTLFVVLTVAMTWPLGAHISEGFIGVANYWDAWTNSMIMTARSEALLGSDAIGLRDSYYFAPVSPSMVFNENLF
ncbi:MAG: hypothetical protein QF464_12045, partial [Myxococcota bacterium]|nr:hypothetical protein [Myxococcota bacterium]